MLALPVSCPANTLRAQLKHSWLENEILRVDADRIVSRWKKRVWLDTLNSEVQSRLQQVLELADIITEGFSPAQLINDLAPLKSLPDILRNKIQKVIHDVYLEATSITSLEASIREASLSLQKEFDALRNIWEMPTTIENENLIRQCWRKVITKSNTLHVLLEELPKGVVLP